MNQPIVEQWVDADDYAVVTADVVLTAGLRAAFVLCVYDAVQEAGALVHLRLGTAHGGSRDPNLSDTTLLNDLVLLEQGVSELRQASPRAQHWQARLIAQVEDLPPAHERFRHLQSFVTAFLADAGIPLIAAMSHVEPSVVVRFRPAMGQVRTEAGRAARTP
jgi:chemotaxis receptor (MCP) glutamine deamidase CheD